MTHQTDVDVLIVGAGPTGLTLACLLAKYGVKFKIIEKNKTITTRSKALAVQARTLELFEQLGIAKKAVEQGHAAEGLDLMVQGKLRATMDLRAFGAGLTKYPYVLILEQCKTEQLLLERLHASGSEVEWQKELVELQQHPNFVTATVQHLGNLETVRAKYLVAADGARSAVRTMLRLPFEGETYENHFLLADVAIRGEISRRHITLCLSQKGFAGFFPMYGTDRFRAIGILPERMWENVEKEFPAIAKKIEEQAQLPMTISDPLWISAYKLHHRSLERFKEQRCFFAGDAAHVHSPAGGQGMNTGIQDSFNLAWKLRWVLTGSAHESLLETYHEERFPIAKKLLRTTDQVFSFVTSRRAFLRFSRLYMLAPVIKIMTKGVRFRLFAFKTISQIGISYPQCKLSEQSFNSSAAHRAGDRLCAEVLDGGFQAYMVGGQEVQQDFSHLLQCYFEEKIKVYTLEKNPEVQAVLQSFGIDKDGLVLVRPDGYAAYCSDGFDSKALQSYLNRFFSPMHVYRKREFEKKEHLSFENFIY
jgi:2-polyprenyl-6-methoxyphenol hydroxylase-like FAD-dependent oxidoreductase